ncbi:Outer membrane porin, OmpC family [Paraburkholderia ribeironis]|uniref:Outer membrane porin, OmpC family n=1 Tax=Paraburkholderia ribeironis TaxID=1247936 RepID=A0A1N7SN90_9BURK|nr:porin [Paraburkholderia ribeironis]SIT48401.1 Outer membrane porin, OmpC family [Paraburkholderia ribeironis]
MRKAVYAVAMGVIFGLVCVSSRAQTSVMLYGALDVLIDISNQGGGTLTKIANGGTFGSRLGLMGSEAFGNGYKTVFRLESGFAPNDGTIQQSGALFGRQAYIGFEGPEGILTFGRQYSPEFLALSDNDVFSGGLGGSVWNVDRTLPNGAVQGTLLTEIITCRVNNSILYSSPKIVGFSVGLMYGLGGGAESTSGGTSFSGAINYTNGTATFHAGYVHQKDASDFGYYKAWGLGGNYVIGPARVYFGYTKDDYSVRTGAASSKNRLEYAIVNLGASYQFTRSTVVMAQVMKLIDMSGGVIRSQNAYIVGLGGIYSLSKQTSLYVGYAQTKNKNGAAYTLGQALYYGEPASPNSTARVFRFGLRTTF